jgi:hypothetical protein
MSILNDEHQMLDEKPVCSFTWITLSRQVVWAKNEEWRVSQNRQEQAPSPNARYIQQNLCTICIRDWERPRACCTCLMLAITFKEWEYQGKLVSTMWRSSLIITNGPGFPALLPWPLRAQGVGKGGLCVMLGKDMFNNTKENYARQCSI